MESLAACHAEGRVAFKVDRKSRKCSHLFEEALIERLGFFYVCRKRNEISKEKWQFSWLYFLLDSLAACHAGGRVALKLDKKHINIATYIEIIK
ncbi:hypothetical protein A6D99_18665 [Aliivibrio fischeri]|nr:hypothetical protein A6D99_18665 [Aliivibrio fischeri]